MSLIKTRSIPKTYLIKNKKLLMTIEGELDNEDLNEIEYTINSYNK